MRNNTARNHNDVPAEMLPALVEDLLTDVCMWSNGRVLRSVVQYNTIFV